MWLLTVMLDQSDQYALFKMTEFARDGYSPKLCCSAEKSKRNKIMSRIQSKKQPDQGGLSISVRSNRGSMDVIYTSHNS